MRPMSVERRWQRCRKDEGADRTLFPGASNKDHLKRGGRRWALEKARVPCWIAEADVSLGWGPHAWALNELPLL